VLESLQCQLTILRSFATVRRTEEDTTFAVRNGLCPTSSRTVHRLPPLPATPEAARDSPGLFDSVLGADPSPIA